MRTFVFIAACTLGTLPPGAAAGKPPASAPVCYVAGRESKPFQVEPVSLATMREQHPNLESDPKRPKPVLRWEPLPAGVTVTAEMIGRFKGREIYRVVYKKKTEQDEEFDFALLALDDRADRNPDALRPFFLLPCDQVGWLRVTLVSNEEIPFGVEVEQTLQGTGVFTNIWSFKFNGAGARLVLLVEEARKMDAKVHRYH